MSNSPSTSKTLFKSHSAHFLPLFQSPSRKSNFSWTWKITFVMAFLTSFCLLLVAFNFQADLFSLYAGSNVTPILGVTAQSQYLVGVGIADITGPVVETNMMGYASLAQTNTGLHMRQRARAFIIADPNNSTDRVVLVNCDIAMGDTAARAQSLQKLQSLYPGLYSENNFALLGTHQHSGVGGYLQNLLPQLTSLGLVPATLQAIVDGTVLAVQRAQTNLELSTLSLGNVTLLNSNINRSPSAYLANPASERALYPYDQDKDFTLLKIVGSSSGNAKGFLSFFAVHGTSIYENNTLTSTDNKGMAAYLYENYVEPNSMPGNNTFVAGFVQSNVGDTSPNTLGAFCESPGQPWDGQACDFQTSTCGNATEDCHGRGPGFTQDAYGFASNAIIGTNQFNAAKTLMSATNLSSVSGPVKSVHIYVDMTSYSFKLANGTQVTTCPPAMGYSFAAGTTDGPGAFDFTQADNATQQQNPFWEIVKGAVTPAPSSQQAACQYPKPILLNTGYANTPYQWTPHIADIQLFRVGNFVMLVVPGEFTTMAGRRLRNAVRTALIQQGILGNNAYVVIAGLANTYTHYVTTVEEYGVQRYEGASTIYGPYTSEAYFNLYTKLVTYLNPNTTTSPDPGPSPPNLIPSAISLQTPVVQDNAPIGTSFGSVVTDVSTSITYRPGNSVSATFVGANPRNNLRLEGTFMTVERQVNNAWQVYRTDSHPSTIFNWTRTNFVLGYSQVNLTWTIESDAPAGSYRFRYFGDAKALFTGAISPFIGTSSTFKLGS